MPKTRPLNAELYKKKWLLIEAGVLTFPAMLLMAQVVPMLLFMLVFTVFRLGPAELSFLEHITGFLPYVGGAFGLWML